MIGKIVLALRNLLPGLALLCFAIGAFIPVGLMPGSVADGTPFVLCPQQNAILAELLTNEPSSGGHHQHQHTADSASSFGTDKCSCASAASAFILAELEMNAVIAEGAVALPIGTQTLTLSLRPSSRSARG
ncbi:MAG: hypothetical protein ACR2Q3_17425, partial [Woeseiaceae bacterium]